MSRAKYLALTTLVLVTGCRAAARETSYPAVRASATRLASNCQPVWVGKSQMIFNSRKADGHWEAYLGNARCGGGKPLLPPTPGHRGASDVTPDGRYVLFETDFGSHPGRSWAEPGKGVDNDLVLLDRSNGRVTRLTSGRKGTIWGRLKSDGSKVTWSQMTKTPLGSGHPKDDLLGVWQIHAADITPRGTLANERSWDRGRGFYETYGWLGDKIMFASDAGVRPKSALGSWMSAQDWLIPDTLPRGASATRVSRPMPKANGGTSNDYHEFMTVAPAGMFDHGPWILTSMVHETRGMDLWRVAPDGSGLKRVTFFNGDGKRRVKGFPEPRYSIVGGLAVDAGRPKYIYAGVTNDIQSKSISCWRITVA